jgi:hypothetical protein
MNALKLVQTSPASNPDKMSCALTVSGDYTNGTPDPLPLNAISDPTAIGVIPNAGSETNPPSIPPRVYGFAGGYEAQVQKTVANGQTTFGLRWYLGGVELASGAFPAAISGGQLFCDVLANLPQQS